MEFSQFYKGSRKIAVLFLSPHCNMTCEHCITQDNFDTLEFNQAVDIIHQLKQWNFNNLILGGGEPLTWPHDIQALTKVARENSFFVQIGTNGIRLPDFYDKLQWVDRIILPLESNEAVIHDSMRHYVKGHHELILKNMIHLRSLGVSLTLSTVVTQLNFKGLEKLADTLSRFQQQYGGIHAWHLYQFIPLGRGGGLNADNLELSESKYHYYTNQIKSHHTEFQIFKRPHMYLSRDVEFFWSKNSKLQLGGK